MNNCGKGFLDSIIIIHSIFVDRKIQSLWIASDTFVSAERGKQVTCTQGGYMKMKLHTITYILKYIQNSFHIIHPL